MSTNPTLTIGIRLPDGHIPVQYFRQQNVGVGGSSRWFTGPFTGGPVRRATLSELRHLDRRQVMQMQQQHPAGSIFFSRGRMGQ